MAVQPGKAKRTFSFSQDVVDIIERRSLGYKCLDGEVTRSRSRYIEDLVRRDDARKRKA